MAALGDSCRIADCFGITFELPGHRRWRVDAGAARAVRERGKSLLASGITEVDGEFQKGDVVGISTGAEELARGLSNYSSAEVREIMGLRSNQIAKKLGSKPYDEVIHRDNMFLL